MGKYQRTCKHFTGFNPTGHCEAGLPYGSFVPISFANMPPCLNPDSITTCPSATYPTPEESAQFHKELAAKTQRLNDLFDNWVCPHCGADILNERQIGRCAYAEPCGHRIYQGTARGKRPANPGKR